MPPRLQNIPGGAHPRLRAAIDAHSNHYAKLFTAAIFKPDIDKFVAWGELVERNPKLCWENSASKSGLRA